MNLGPPSWATTSERPFQRGRVLGMLHGHRNAQDVEWLVDTGAEISTVRNQIGADRKSVV